MFTTPKRANKNVTPTESLITNEQQNKYSIVIADNEEQTLSSALHNGISTISKDKQEDINDTSEFEKKYEILCEKESSQNRIWTFKYKLDNLKHLSDLSVVSVIKFCSDYCRYLLSVSEPVKIQNYINDKVKTMFVRTKTAKQWRVLSVADFDNLSINDMMLLLQDYCVPASQAEFYMNLKASTAYSSIKSVFDIESNNFESFYQEFNLYMKKFKYSYAFLLDYTASKHEIPYINTKSRSTTTLRDLFLSGLPKNFIDNVYGKAHKRLSRFKSIYSLIESTEKTVCILHKQYCKNHEVNDMT